MQLYCKDQNHQGLNPLGDEYFHKNSRHKSGYQLYCKECHQHRYGVAAKLRTKKYNENNPTHRQEYYVANKKELADKRHQAYIGTYGEKARAYGRKYYEKNKDNYQVAAKKYHRLHKTEKREYAKEWRRSNKGKVNEYQMFRYAQLVKATPSWYLSEREEIQAIYERAAELTRTTGIKHEVDHIIPILGKTVCGLHCKDNLQILTKSENASKNNRLST